MSKYEYRITSDNAGENITTVCANSWANTEYMLDRADIRMRKGATWAQVEFVRIDDDGTHEVLRRLRLD